MTAHPEISHEKRRISHAKFPLEILVKMTCPPRALFFSLLETASSETVLTRRNSHAKEIFFRIGNSHAKSSFFRTKFGLCGHPNRSQRVTNYLVNLSRATGGLSGLSGSRHPLSISSSFHFSAPSTMNFQCARNTVMAIDYVLLKHLVISTIVLGYSQAKI